MLWRHLSRVRAWSAAGLLTCTMLGTATLARAEPEPAAPPTDSQTVAVLDAQKAGDLGLEVRGAGQDRVRLTLDNKTARRLNVILPPGLVASSLAGQRGGGGFQSMGLGDVGNRPGAFGRFQNEGDATGFRSVPVRAEPETHAVAVPPGQSVELFLPAVCLNYGKPTPTYRDKFHLVDVTDYSPNPRVRKALRSLSQTGTSLGVAQAVMWNVCNDLPFDLMLAQAGKLINPQEVALAARFVAAVDASTGSDRVDPAYIAESRIFVSLRGDAAQGPVAERLAGELDGLRVLGLPVRVIDARELPELTAAPALSLSVTLSTGRAGETQGRVHVSQALAPGQWVPLAKASFSGSDLDGRGLAQALDRAIAGPTVSVKVAKRGATSTTLKIDNRLPFTLANVAVTTGTSSHAPEVPYPGLGIGPGRSAQVQIQAPGAVVERVELNGL